jgi:hypothetical protein
MSRDHDDHAKLSRLAEAFAESILALSDDDVLAEVGDERIARVQKIVTDVASNVSKQALSKAKAEREAWTASQPSSVVSLPPSVARSQFDQIRRNDRELDQRMTLAARKGEAPTDRDIEGLMSDWEDLKRLDGRDKSE